MLRPCSGPGKLWLSRGAPETQEGTEGPKEWFGESSERSVPVHGSWSPSPLVSLTTQAHTCLCLPGSTGE